MTKQMIMKIRTTTYVPATPITGASTFVIFSPMIPPILSTNSRSAQVRTTNISPAAVFKYAFTFPLFEIRNATIPNNRNGTT